MLQFNNTHIFTGYLKQLMADVNIPKCHIYTPEFTQYFAEHGKEDPRVVESFDTLFSDDVAMRAACRINYLKTDNVFNYFLSDDSMHGGWTQCTNITYDPDYADQMLTKSFKSTTVEYDIHTHEYLGDYLRFLRDYHNVNLMSLYNCFNNKVRSNIFYSFKLNSSESVESDSDESKVSVDGDDTNVEAAQNTQDALIEKKIKFDSRDTNYKLYAIPVKLFSNYTIAIDSPLGVEMFCTFYDKTIELSDKTTDLAKRTYRRVNHAAFNQPFLYDALDVKFWDRAVEYQPYNNGHIFLKNNKKIARCDVLLKEKDLKLVIKVPATAKSSIVILEGDYRNYNSTLYTPTSNTWQYKTNHAVHNFKRSVINKLYIRPISKLQLLAFNTGISYPFADRLIEYLTGSAITSMDQISDNIARVQQVMLQKAPNLTSEILDREVVDYITKLKNEGKDTSNIYVPTLPRAIQVQGVWENSMQKIIYDYMQNSGPFEVHDFGTPEKPDKKIIDKRQGRHKHFGKTSKSARYDILGYVDKEAEKCFASWQIDKDGRLRLMDTSQTVDIYNGLYNIK